MIMDIDPAMVMVYCYALWQNADMDGEDRDNAG